MSTLDSGNINIRKNNQLIVLYIVIQNFKNILEAKVNFMNFFKNQTIFVVH